MTGICAKLCAGLLGITINCHVTIAMMHGGLQRLGQPRQVVIAQSQTILNDMNLLFGTSLDSRVALLIEPLQYLVFTETVWHRYRQADMQARLGRQVLEQVGNNPLSIITSYFTLTARAMQVRKSGKHQLQIIIQLG